MNDVVTTWWAEAFPLDQFSSSFSLRATRTPRPAETLRRQPHRGLGAEQMKSPTPTVVAMTTCTTKARRRPGHTCSGLPLVAMTRLANMVLSGNSRRDHRNTARTTPSFTNAPLAGRKGTPSHEPQPTARLATSDSRPSRKMLRGQGVRVGGSAAAGLVWIVAREPRHFVQEPVWAASRCRGHARRTAVRRMRLSASARNSWPTHRCAPRRRSRCRPTRRVMAVTCSTRPGATASISRR